MAELAKANASANAGIGSFEIHQGSILSPPSDIQRVQFDHVICNPPYLPKGFGSGQPSLENQESDAALADWVSFATARVRDSGSVVFVHRADRLDELLSYMRESLGALVVLPLWPKHGVAAKRVIVGGLKGRRTPLNLLAGVTLHQADGRYTDEADAVLRGHASLDLWPS